MTDTKALELANLRKAFRTSMWLNFRTPGENVASCAARLRADPATAKTAKLLKCTVDELLKGLGTPEALEGPPGFDLAKAKEDVAQVVHKVATRKAAGRARDTSGKEKSGTQMGALAAPKEGEQTGKVLGSKEAAAQVLKEKQQLAQRLMKPTAVPTKAKALKAVKKKIVQKKK